MLIQIIGAGSIGLLLAGRLGDLCKLTLITRSKEQADLIQSSGLSVAENGRVRQVRTNAMRLEGWTEQVREPDWIFLAVKQKDLTDRLIDTLAERVSGATRLLCFQNGIGHTERLAARLEPWRIHLALTTEGAKRTSPASVDHTGSGTTRIGPAFSEGGAEPEGIQAADMLIALMNTAGLHTVRASDVRTAVWEKLLVNAAINPLTAILRIPNGALLELSSALSVMEGLYLEGRAAAEAAGINPDPQLWLHILEVCRKTASNRSSMLQDLESGRKTENEWISGGILKTAEAHGLDLHVTRTVYRLVKAAEGL